MPQYAVIQSHPPDNCPLANNAVREFAKKAVASLPQLERELGVKTVAPPIPTPVIKPFCFSKRPLLKWQEISWCAVASCILPICSSIWSHR
jgi:hypothetical protein